MAREMRARSANTAVEIRRLKRAARRCSPTVRSARRTALGTWALDLGTLLTYHIYSAIVNSDSYMIHYWFRIERLRPLEDENRRLTRVIRDRGMALAALLRGEPEVAPGFRVSRRTPIGVRPGRARDRRDRGGAAPLGSDDFVVH